MNYSKFAGLGWRQCQLWLLSLACLFLLNGQALAEVAANVSFVSGVVTASTSGASARELAKGNDIFSGDSIDTADNGRIQMRFTDGGLVSLMPRTTFSVDEYLHEGKSAEDGSLVFGMLRGGMRTITGSIGKIKHENYELKTPVATLGIRGTEYVAVIGPPDTLRVHVGKGKVVITNDHGTLEVPEGRNAVVVLGSAPEFSDQGPQYLAAGIGGDKALIAGLIDQDPYGVDVTLDMPTAFDEAQRLASNPPPGVTPPTGPVAPPVTPPAPPVSPIPPSGPGYLMAGYTDFGSGSMSPFSSGATTFTATFDQATGALLDVIDSNTTFGSLTTGNVGYLGGNISWGEFNAGTGTLFNQSISGISPYVTGSAVQTLPTGSLGYSLADPTHATLARGSFGSIGTLDSFNLMIDVTNLNYNFNMGLVMTADTFTAAGSGSLASGFQDNFSLTGNSVNQNGSDCMSNGCTFNASGFLAGPNAEQAGVSYNLNTGFEPITGAAALSR
ncbi:MAG: FecR domain-containing protein [Burkholderiaceae bacterium]|nr:FecR domain-containing protein [Burkholderiaceae bacterium]